MLGMPHLHVEGLQVLSLVWSALSSVSSPAATRTTRTPSRVHATMSLLQAFSLTALFPSSFFLGQGRKQLLLQQLLFYYFYSQQGLKILSSLLELTQLLLAPPHIFQSEFTHAPGMSSGRSQIG